MLVKRTLEQSSWDATDLDRKVTAVHDGCAAPDLEFEGAFVPGATVHAAFMAALADGYAEVVSSDSLVRP